MVDFTITSNFLWLPLIGFVIGLLVTIFGGGGGFFYVPILILLFHVNTQLAVVTSLAATIPTVIVGSIEHYKKGNIDLKVGVIFGVAGLIGALLGAYISHLISSSLLKKLFGLYSILLTVPMILTSKNRLKNLNNKTIVSKPLTSIRTLLCSFFGILSGLMAGLFGTSGTASIVAGLYILGLPVTIIVGTSVLVVLFNAVSGLAGHLLVGQFNLMLFLLLGSGSIIGGFLGPRILAKINVQTLEKVYGILFILLVLSCGIIMFFK
ncbi:MAG: sulfite exporter TauE/SafE family protein [Bacteroidales bacterium]